MNPHLYKDKYSSKWVCVLKEPAIQRGVAAPLTMYAGTGATPVEAYEKYKKVYSERNAGTKC